MSHVIRVIAAVVDQYQLTLYKEDGSEHIIKQGDPELRRVLDVVMPIIQDGQVAEVEMGKNSDQGKEYKDFEKKTNGLVQFFKVMKAEAEKFLTQLASTTEDDPVAPLILGSVPTRNPAVTGVQVTRKESPQANEAKTKQSAAVAEVMANAIPTSSEAFSAPKADQHDDNGALIAGGDETIIAVVGGKVIPGVEKLASQFEYAAKEGNSTVGMERFLARLGAVISNRGHSIQDLLKFLERGDLPIADDGSFVAYKILRKKDNHFVDCHSGKVPQQIGSYVHMDESMVDHNRRKECSNGLHVARRGYISKFNGDLCTLIKVAPEDVIAVPDYDANKMRVCGYHIIDLLSQADYSKLRSDNSITDTMAAKIQLGKALSGDHVGILERVKITESMGGGIQITPVLEKAKAKKVVKAQATNTKKRVSNAIKVKETKPRVDAPAVDAKAVAKQVTDMKATGGSARQLKAGELVQKVLTAEDPTEAYKAATELVEFKKASKVSWEKLGVSKFEADRAISVASTEPVFAEQKPTPVEVMQRGRVTKAPVAKGKPKKVSKPAKPDLAAALGALTPKQQEFANLYAKVQKGDKKAAAELLSKKKASKKSWDALGLPKQAGEACEKLLTKAKK